MEKQLSKRNADLDEKIEDYRIENSDFSENIDIISKQLLDLNKGNLKQTYQLEDMQMEYDMLAAQEDGGSLFLTN